MFDTFCQQAVLRKFNDIQTFVKSSLKTLDDVISEVGVDKNKFEPKPELKPLSINTDKAVQVIWNFKIEPK